MFSRRNIETAQCPVCKAILGQRDKAAIFKAHCVECRAVFLWKPRADRPVAVLDADIKKERRYCGPDGCVCRD